MKKLYGDLFDYIINRTIPATNKDIKSIYNFYTGGNGWKDKELYKVCEACGSLERFTNLYREIERDIIENYSED